jgi:hypothetical protein
VELRLDGEDTADNLLDRLVAVLRHLLVEGRELLLGLEVDGGLRARGLARVLLGVNVSGDMRRRDPIKDVCACWVSGPISVI